MNGVEKFGYVEIECFLWTETASRQRGAEWPSEVSWPFSKEPQLPLKAQRSAAGHAGRGVGSYLVPMEIRVTGIFSKSSAEKKHCTEMGPWLKSHPNQIPCFHSEGR